MKRKRLEKRFELENLEPRILLSGDPLVGALAAIAPGDPDADKTGLSSLEEVLTADQTKLEASAASPESYNPEDSIDDIFAGIEGEDLSPGATEGQAGSQQSDDADPAVGETEEAQIARGLAELVRLGETIELSEALASLLPGLGDTSLGELIGLTEILDSRLAKSVYDHFGDAVDPPTVAGVVQALNDSLNALGDLEIKVSSLAGGVVSGDNELHFDVAFTATRTGQLLLTAEQTGADQGDSADYVTTLELDIRFGLDLDQQDGFFLLVRGFTLNLTVSTADNPAGSAGLGEARVDVVFDGAAGADGRLSLAELQAINVGELALDIQTSGSLFQDEGANIAPSFLVSGLVAAESETIESPLALDDGESGSSAVTTNYTDLDLGPGDTTVIEIRGAADFDDIVVSGNADLGGTLNINLNGFTPAAGDVFEIVTFGSATGAFADFQGLDLGGGLRFVPVQAADTFFLVTVDRGVAVGLAVTIQAKLDEYIAGTQSGDITLDFAAIDLGGFAQLLDLSIIFENLVYDGGTFTAGTVTIEAGSAVFFPGQLLSAGVSDGGDGDALAISGTFDPNAGTFSLAVDQLDLAVNGIFTAHADTLTLSYDPAGSASQPVLSIASADLVFQALDDTTATVNNLTVLRDGFSLDNATVAAPDISWAGVFELTSPTLTFANLDYSNAGSGTLTGTVTIGASSVSLFEGLGAFTSTITGFTGSYNFGTEALSVTATTLDLDFGAVVVDAATVTFELDPAADTLLVSTGPSSISVAGFVTVSGSFGFLEEGGDIQVAATGVEATLGAGGFSAGVTGGTFAMLLNADGTVALQADGSVILTGGDFASASATSVSVEYNDTGANIDTSVTVGAITAPIDVIDGTTKVEVVGLSVELGSFLSLGGDFAFRKDGSGNIEAAANNVSAALGAGGFSVGVNSGTLALLLKTDDTIALQASGGLTFSGGSFGSANATLVTVKYNTTGAAIDTDVTIGLVTGELDVGIGVQSVEVVGLSVELGGFVTFGGDFAFRKDGSGNIEAAANNVTASLGAGSFLVGVNSGTLVLLLKTDDTVALQASGGLTFSGGSFGSANATLVTVKYNTTGAAIDTDVTIGLVTGELDVGIGVQSVEVVGLSVELGGFVTFGGDFAFRKDGSGNIEAAANNVTASLGAGSFLVGVNSGTLVLLLKTDDTVALQASGGLTFSGGSFGSANATLVTVKYNTTGAAIDTDVTIGLVTGELDVGIGVQSVEVVGLSVELGGFVSLGGDFAFRKDGSGNIEAAANNVTASLGAGSFLVGVNSGTLALLMKTDDTIALQASGGLTFSGGSFAGPSATLVTVKYNTTGAAIDTSVTIGTVSGDLDVGIGVQIVEVTGLSVELGSFLSLGGDFAFRKDGSGNIEAAANNVSATLGAGGFSVGVNSGTLALLLKTDDTVALQASGGLTFSGGSFGSANATLVTVKYNTTGAAIDTDVTIGLVTGELDVGIGVQSVEVVGLSVELGGFVTFGGDFAFRKDGSGNIEAAANNVTATLGAGGFSVGVNSGTLALLLKTDDTVALQASGGLTFSGGSFGSANATLVTVKFNTTGAAIDTSVTIGTVSGDLDVGIGVQSVEVVGLSVELGGFVSFGGDFAFRKDGSGNIEAAANNVSATLGAGGFSVGVNSGTLALLLKADNTVALQASGGLTFSGGIFGSASATLVTVKYNTTGAAIDTAVTIGAVSGVLDVGIGVQSVEVVGLSVDVLGFVSLSGDVGFTKDGTDIVAVGSSVTARLEVTSSVYVELANANFGLMLGTGGVAFELSNGTLDIQLGPLGGITADEIFVQFTNVTTTVAADTTIAVGPLSYTFDQEILPSTIAFAVVSVSFDIGGVFSVSGDIGFKKVGVVLPEIVAVGNNITVRLEATSSVYLELADADFGMISGAGKFAFEMSNGAPDIQLGPLGGITADEIFVQFTNVTTTVAAGTTIAVGPLSYTFDQEILPSTIAFAVVGISFDIGGVFSVSGDIGFKKVGVALPEIVAVGNNVTVRLEATSSVYVELADADFGMISGAGKFAFEMSNGALDIQLGPLGGITADEIFVQFTNVTTTVAADTTIAVGPLSYTFDQEILPSTIAFAVVGVSFDIGGVFSVSGDIGFRKAGVGVPEIVAVGNDVTVRLEATSSVYVELADADFGLISGGGKFVFEMKNGALDIQLGPIANITAVDTFVQFSGPLVTSTVLADTTITVGPVSYTFDEEIVPNTIAVAVVGFNADIGGGVFHLSGDIGFKKSGVLPQILAVGSDVTVRLEATSTVYVELADADFGLISGAGVFAFELTNGALDIQLGPIANITATEIFVQFSGTPNPAAPLDPIVAAGTTINVGPVSYTFTEDIDPNTVAFAVVGLNADIGGVFHLSGDIGFKKSGVVPQILAVGSDVTVRLEATSTVYVELADADFGLISGAGVFAFELTNGALDIQLGPIANITATEIFVQFSGTPNPAAPLDPIVAAGTTINVGPVSYTFTEDIDPNTVAFAVVDFNADIGGVFHLSGDIGFKKSGVLPQILAVGSDVTVRLEATSTVYVELADADFGLISGAGVFAFELTNGALDIQLGDFADITATEIFVQFSGAPNPAAPLDPIVAAGTTINVGPVSYTFTEDIDPNTIAFAVRGLDAKVGGVLTITGDLGFSKSLTLIKVVANPLNAKLEFSSSVFAEITNARFGLKAGLEGGQPVFAFELTDGTLNVSLGPVGHFVVTKVFVQVTGPTTAITAFDPVTGTGDRIQIGPVSYEFQRDIDPATLAVQIEGKLVLGPDESNGLVLDGAFKLEVGTDGLALAVGAKLGLGPLGQMDALGGLRIDDAGLVGRVQLTLDGNLGTVGLDITGFFLLEINTSSVAQELEVFDFKAGGGPEPFELKLVTIQPGLLVRAEATLDFLGFLQASASLEIRLTAGSFFLGGTAQINLGDLINVQINLNVLVTSSGITLAADLTIDADIAGAITIKTMGTLRINTVNAPVTLTHNEGTPNEVSITLLANSFLIDVSGDVSIFGVLTFNTQLKIQVGGGTFSHIGSALAPSGTDANLLVGQWAVSFTGNINLFGIVSLGANGWLNHQGHFAVRLDGEIVIGTRSFGIVGDFFVAASWSEVGGSEVVQFAGSASAKVILGGWDIAGASVSFTLHGSGLITITGEIHLSFFFFSVDISKTFTVGLFKKPDPIWLAGSTSVNRLPNGSDVGVGAGNGTLILNVGSATRRTHRSLLSGETDETIIIEHLGGTAGNETVKVSGFGRTQQFSGVSRIVADADNGDDLIIVRDGVLASVDFDGGSGNDVIVVGSAGGTGNIIDGGSGNDYIELGSGIAVPFTINGNAGEDHILAGAAADTINGGPGNDVIFGRNGADTINGGTGADTIYGEVGADVLRGDAGADTFVWTPGHGIDAVIDGGADNDTLSVSTGDGSDLVTVTTPGANTVRLSWAAELLDASSVEGLNINLGQGADTLTVNDLFDSGVTTLSIDLGRVNSNAANPNVNPNNSAGDVADDSVALFGRPISDNFTVTTRTVVANGDELVDILQGVYNTNIVGGVWDEGDDLTVSAEAGGDTITGAGVSTRLLAMTFNGGSGSDTLIGTPFIDNLNSGTGSDTVTGGIGLDVFTDTSTAGSGDVDTLVETFSGDVSLFDDYLVHGEILGDGGGVFHKGIFTDEQLQLPVDPLFPAPFVDALRDRGDVYASTYGVAGAPVEVEVLLQADGVTPIFERAILTGSTDNNIMVVGDFDNSITVGGNPTTVAHWTGEVTLDNFGNGGRGSSDGDSFNEYYIVNLVDNVGTKVTIGDSGAGNGFSEMYVYGTDLADAATLLGTGPGSGATGVVIFGDRYDPSGALIPKKTRNAADTADVAVYYELSGGLRVQRDDGEGAIWDLGAGTTPETGALEIWEETLTPTSQAVLVSGA